VTQLCGGDTVLRANPDYELVLLDRLALSEQFKFRDGYDGDDLYGALLPRSDDSRLEPRAVSTDTALLLLSLASPGPLPRYVIERLGTAAERTVQRLVVDEVLQVRRGNDFVSGAGAVAVPVCAQAEATLFTQNLAVAALTYGQRLSGLSVEELGRRLYFYGRQPVSPLLRCRFASMLAAEEHLGGGLSGLVQSMLPVGWYALSSPIDANRDAYWWQWGYQPSLARARHRGGHKLYISPAVDSMAPVLEQVVRVIIAAHGVRGFKVASGVAGICRPDKIVVYVEHLDDLLEVADRLASDLSGSPAYGVPFTAAVTHDGLLAWGIDPPSGRFATPRATSWRMWLTQRLAGYLAEFTPSDGTEPWEYALERLRLSGINIRTWEPAVGLWLDSADED
jgi:hypothetical protein